jgi:hypothetical protein
VFACFRVFVSCRVWVKTEKKSLHSKQVIKHENMQTLNYNQKEHSG